MDQRVAVQAESRVHAAVTVQSSIGRSCADWICQALPSLLGFSIMMFQASSLCFTIALPEIVSRASSIGSSTFEYMPVLILAGLMYAAVCAPATLGVAALEKRLAPSQP